MFTAVLLCVSFVCSILLWHRSDNLAFAIIAGGSVKPGEGVECKIRGILQVRLMSQSCVRALPSQVLERGWQLDAKETLMLMSAATPLCWATRVVARASHVEFHSQRLSM